MMWWIYTSVDPPLLLCRNAVKTFDGIALFAFRQLLAPTACQPYTTTVTVSVETINKKGDSLSRAHHAPPAGMLNVFRIIPFLL